jgi:putative endonuclease
MTDAHFFVYILASQSRVLYTGVTRDLIRRVHQHRIAQVPGFTQKYRVNRLVYFEETPSARSAFERERQIKAWSREKKLRLIESANAGWLDLAVDWFPKIE